MINSSSLRGLFRFARARRTRFTRAVNHTRIKHTRIYITITHVLYFAGRPATAHTQIGFKCYVCGAPPARAACSSRSGPLREAKRKCAV